MYKVSNHKDGAIYRTSKGNYLLKGENTQSEEFGTLTELVLSLQSNDEVSKTSERDNADNSTSQTKKKPRKKATKKATPKVV